jgi:DNA polymerase I-like protein with 3'-5' exonuclease and polymerase domains
MVAVKTKTRKIKAVKIKYTPGCFLRCENGLEFEVTNVLYTYDSEFEDICIGGYYVGKNLENDEEVLINVSEKFKKFTKKVTKEEKELLECQASRANFKYVDAGSKLLDFIEFPNTENIKYLASADEIGFDIETLGIEKQSDALIPELGRIRLIQAYLPEIDKCIIWDLGVLEYPKNIDEMFGIKTLKKKLASRDCKIYIHNARFESAWIAEHFKIPIFNVIDSLILSQLYWAGLIRGFNKIGVKNPNSLEQVTLRLFGIKPDKTNQGYDYAMPLGNSQYNYAAMDAKLTYNASVKLLDMCLKEGMHKVVEAEMMAIPAFAQMNYKGVPVNPEKLKELLEIYTKTANEIIQPWLETFPNCNPGSSKQVLECLKEKWNIEPYSVDSKTKEKKLSSDNATLTPYALENPIIDALLFWRSLKKDCEYLEQYIESVKFVRGFTILRGNYTQNAPQCTGRSSSSSVNLQNIPTPTPKRKKLGLPPLRTAFEAPPGYKFILVDLAASHSQIARYLAQDKKLIEANESGVKVHFYTVQGLLAMQGIKAEVKELEKAKKDKNHPLAKYVSELYDPAKTILYGGLNLNGAVTLQASFLKKADMLVSLETCKEYVDGGRKTYYGIYEFQKQTIKKTNSMREHKTFEVMTEWGIRKVGALTGVYGTSRSIDGGRLFIEKMPNKFKPGVLEASATDAVSYQWLRTEGTIMKKSLALVNNFLIENKIVGWLSQFCHDEAMCCVREESAYQVAEFMINKITETFRELIPDYNPESLNPNDYIIDNWSQK